MSLTFSVVAEAHLGLAETNGVLALADAIELFELCLVDALHATRQPPMALEGEMFGRWRLTWLGTYSSMALMPTFWGLSDMMCVLCVVKEEDGRVQAFFFIGGVCGRTIQWVARWGLNVKERSFAEWNCEEEWEIGGGGGSRRAMDSTGREDNNYIKAAAALVRPIMVP
jgi:hypothetical protein